MIEHYLSMLRPLGIESPAVRFDLPERAADAEMADAFLAHERLVGRRFAVLNPGAGWPSKIWPAERYGELARHLHKRTACASVAAWGLPAELPLAETIVAASDGHALFAPPTTMMELAALCRRAALFVGSDTGPMHLAVAVGTPTISMHGPSRADWCGAYGPQNIRLQIRYEDGLVARASPGRRLGHAGDHGRHGGARVRSTAAACMRRDNAGEHYRYSLTQSARKAI